MSLKYRGMVKAMREWLADIEWAELEPEDLEEKSDPEIIRAVERHYEGGMEAFIRDMGLTEPSPVE